MEALANANLLLIDGFLKLVELFELDSLRLFDLIKQISLLLFHIIDELLFLSGLILHLFCLSNKVVVLCHLVVPDVALDLRMLVLILDFPCTHHFLGQVLNALLHDLILYFLLDLLGRIVLASLILMDDRFDLLPALSSHSLFLHVLNLLFAQINLIFLLPLHFLKITLLVNLLDGLHLDGTGPCLFDLSQDAFLLAFQ